MGPARAELGKPSPWESARGMRCCHARALAWRNNFVPYSANRGQVLSDCLAIVTASPMTQLLVIDAAAASPASRPR
jgi:hypothetical protein